MSDYMIEKLYGHAFYAIYEQMNLTEREIYLLVNREKDCLGCGVNKKSQAEVAKEFNLSSARVAQIANKLNRKIQHRVRRLTGGANNYANAKARIEELNEITQKTNQRLLSLHAELGKYIESNIPKNGGIATESLDVSVRTANVLKYNNIEFLAQLQDMTENEILRFPNFGRKSLNELREVCTNFGIKIGSNR